MEETTTFEMPKKRPTFLTVICILSFIMGIYTVGTNAMQFFTFEKNYPAQMEKLEQTMSTLEEAGIDSGFSYNQVENGMIILEKTSQNFPTIIGISLLLTLLSLLGAFMMFKLKKNGFYIYTFANLFALLVPLALIDFSATMFMTAISGIFTIAFIIMYAVNLKHMK